MTVLKRNPDYVVVVTPEFNLSLTSIKPVEYFREKRCFGMLMEVSSAIQVLHANNIVSGSIKPSNVLITNDGHFVLCDNCQYLLYVNSDNSIPMNNRNVNYIAPELLENKPVDKSIDIWNIGTLFYYCLSGENPFEDTNFINKCNRIRRGDFNNINNIDERAMKLLNKMLQVKSQYRLRIEELLAELKQMSGLNYEIVSGTSSANTSFSNDNEKGVAIPAVVSSGGYGGYSGGSGDDCMFLLEGKGKGLVISEDKKTCTHISDISNDTKCYLDIKLDNTTYCYHILFQCRISVKYGSGSFVFGATTNKNANPKPYIEDESSFAIRIVNGGSCMSGANGIRIIERPNIKAVNETRYELIFDLKQKEFRIKHEDEEEILLVKKIGSPLYPYVENVFPDNAIEIMRFWKD